MQASGPLFPHIKDLQDITPEGIQRIGRYPTSDPFVTLLKRLSKQMLGDKGAYPLMQTILSPLIQHTAWIKGTFFVDMLHPASSRTSATTTIRLAAYEGDPPTVSFMHVMDAVPVPVLHLVAAARVFESRQHLDNLVIRIEPITEKDLRGYRLICDRAAVSRPQPKSTEGDAPAPASLKPLPPRPTPRKRRRTTAETLRSMPATPTTPEARTGRTLRPPSNMSVPPDPRSADHPPLPTSIRPPLVRTPNVMGARVSMPPRSEPQSALEAVRSQPRVPTLAPPGESAELVDPLGATPLPLSDNWAAGLRSGNSSPPAPGSTPPIPLVVKKSNARSA